MMSLKCFHSDKLKIYSGSLKKISLFFPRSSKVLNIAESNVYFLNITQLSV